MEAAEAADQAAKDKLAELNADNLITPEEKAQLEAAKQNADTLKEEANSAVQALPDTVAEKGDLQDRVDALDGIQVPEVNDQDGNGRADDLDAAVAAATAAVEAAEAADQAAKDKLAELNADNLITPEEKAQLEAAKQNADTLKEEANSAVQALPDTVAEKGDLQDRVDALDGIQVPEVNDQDGNGRADDLDAAVAAATAAVEAAEAADQAAKDKLAELNADNLITPEEKAQLEAAKQNADTLKEEANSAVQALPDTVAEKGDLQDRVDALDGIQVPEVNDQDGNGRADDLDAAVAAATAAVEAAEAADQAAKDKLAELNADNLITPEEKAQLEAAKQNADTLKEEANSAVQALPDTVAEKGDLQDRVDALDGIQVPEVNDQDGNGRADDLDAAVAAATAAVEAAEAADQAAKDKLAELNADNLITPEEKAQLEAAKQNADTLKEEANSAVQALPDTVAEKGDLQDRVDALDGIQVPEVNDQDGNGRADDLDAAVAAATAAVEAAEAADQAAKDKLAELNADNLITPEEKAQLEAAKQNADTLKEEANSAVQALPDTVAEKGDLQDRVDALDGIQVPEVNDQDGNGRADDLDAAVAAATAAVEAAEAADQAAKDKLAELNADNLITPEEKAQLEAAKQNADTLKEEANSAVQALPDTVAEKGDLQDRVDALDGIQVPEVNDQDGNGRADDLDAAVAAATAAVEAAEAADQAAKDKLAELNADNLITPEEKAQLEAAKQNADTLKEEANSAVQALPDTVAEKGDLQDRVDALDGIQVPEVNDQDGNGIPDFIDSQLAFFNKASSPNVSGDLYPNAPRFSWSTESNKISTVNKNWEGILNANPGAYVTREVISTNVEQYNYNGINGSDIISIKNSLFGLDRTQVDRQPVGLFTGEGNDIIVTGQDYGRNTSLGYTDHANITNMGGAMILLLLVLEIIM
ncbi:gamma-glutamyl-gamma-aminobutyrate hydrolase [Escherichia coli]|nr:gamma-glutamyl-gamma-aminobutyrate hydrolase [Escherichia coli]